MKSKKPLFVLLSMLLMMLLFSASANSQTIEGDWFGKASVQGITLRLNLHIKASGDGFITTWDSPDQGAMGIPSTSTTFKYPDF